MEQLNLAEVLQSIDPAALNYQDWVNVGMALKQEGYPCEVWDSWSQRDSRYRAGECERKWRGFNGSAVPVTGGTIVQLAREQGWGCGSAGHELGWNDEIRDDLVVVDKSWLESREVREPAQWHPARQLITYLETLFEAGENVGYVTESWEKEDKDGLRYLPTRGSFDRTAGQLIEALSRCGDDIGSVLGDYKPEAGAWIRFNPLDGKGAKDENVTEFRYALVESDNMPIEQQNAMIRELELPIACLVYSGGKSLHAIVRIDAADKAEYRSRVDYLYTVLQKNGMVVDTQNKNPSRLSRMPGVIRNGRKQFIVDTNIGRKSWNEWKEWIESVNDNLPEFESLRDCWNDLPELAPCLIDGVLRQGHKMLIAGPSKAGKSFALIELCIAIAEGRKWLQWRCAKGRVLYVNLELDRASCLHRFKDVYEAMQWPITSIGNIDIWNLRGKSLPMDKLAPKLIRRAMKQNYIAVVIDPIYKIITGDENSADQMAAFCNQFDKVCTELGCAVIYCHHHSKGAQGGKKSMDRASGSGVFARDPDAMLDLVELELTPEIIEQQQNAAAAKAWLEWIRLREPTLMNKVSQDDECSPAALERIVRNNLPLWMCEGAMDYIRKVREAAGAYTGWRVEGTLREFPKFKPVDLWFRYPVHQLDESGILGDLDADGGQPNWKKANHSRKKNAADQRQEKTRKYADAVANACAGEAPTTADIVQYFAGTGREVKPDTVRKDLNKLGFSLNSEKRWVKVIEPISRDGTENS